MLRVPWHHDLLGFGDHDSHATLGHGEQGDTRYTGREACAPLWRFRRYSDRRTRSTIAGVSVERTKRQFFQQPAYVTHMASGPSVVVGTVGAPWRARPCGSLVAPRGSPGPPKCEEQLFPVRYKVSRVSSARTALQRCKRRSCWTPHGYP